MRVMPGLRSPGGVGLSGALVFLVVVLLHGEDLFWGVAEMKTLGYSH